MAPILNFLISSGSKNKEPECLCLSEAKAPHSRKMWTEALLRFLQVRLSLRPITYKCLLKVLRPVKCQFAKADFLRKIFASYSSTKFSSQYICFSHLLKVVYQCAVLYITSGVRYCLTGISRARVLNYLVTVVSNDTY